MYRIAASSPWRSRLWLCLAFVLLSAENCSTPVRGIGGVSSGNPIEGKFAILGRAIAPGLGHGLDDGRRFDFSLVQSKNSEGNLEYYVTNDRNGVRNSTSVTVVPPNPPVTISIAVNGVQRVVSILSDNSMPFPFEAVEGSLLGSGYYVDKFAKHEGPNGLGSVLLLKWAGDAEAVLVNVYANGSQESQSNPRSAHQVIVDGKVRYVTDIEGERSEYMQIDSLIAAKFGVVYSDGSLTSENGRLFRISAANGVVSDN